jgi:hypothetical protein
MYTANEVLAGCLILLAVGSLAGCVLYLCIKDFFNKR